MTKPKPEETLKVTQDPSKPVEREILAEAIVRMSKSVQALRASGLNERALVALVHDHCRLPKSDIERVLHALDRLAKDYTR